MRVLRVKGQANFQLGLAFLVPVGDLRVLFTRRVNRDAMSTSLTEKESESLFFAQEKM